MQSDGDWTGYSLASIYEFPVGPFGLLLHMDFDKGRPDIDGDGVPDMLDWNSDGRPDGDASRKEFFVNTFWDLAVTDTVNILGEIKYGVGQWKYDVGPDDDAERYAWNLEVTAPLPMFSPARLTAGWAYMSGDGDSLAASHIVGNHALETQLDNREQTWNRGGIGGDWEKVWILTNDSDMGAPVLGGIGNLVYGAGRYGADLVYLGVTVSPSEDLDLGFLFASSSATDLPKGWDDEHGLEWDLSLSYRIMDNLTYDFIAAFLSTGDFWKFGVNDADVDNAFSIYQILTLTF
jgi:hypothetical protein